MKSPMKCSIGTVVALSLFSIPTIMAHADEGVVTNDFTVKDKDGKVVKEWKANEIVHLKKESETHYQVSVEGKTYKVDKDMILQTIKHEELSLSVKGDAIPLKTTPELFGSILLQLQEGEVLHRVDKVKEQNGFVKVRTNQSVEGWVLKTALKQNIKNVAVQTSAFVKDDSVKDKSISYGEAVTIVGFEDNQYKLSIEDKTVLVDKLAISFTEPPKRIIQPEITPRSEKEDTHHASLADSVIAKAYEYMGVPYVWGGTSPNGFDCSGYTQYVLASQGIHIPRVASEQVKVGETIEKSNLQKGDLIFFETYKPGASHVGIYIGDGQFINASGDRVNVSSINNTYWSQRYLVAKRMF